VSTDTFHLAVVAIAALVLLMQAAVLLGILIGVLKLARTVREKSDEFRVTVMPMLEHSRNLLESTHSIITRIEPRLDAAATDLAQVTNVVRGQVVRYEATANDIHERVHRQVGRVDGMATVVLDGVDHAARVLSNAMRDPARRISGAIAAVNAFVESLNKPAPRKERTVENVTSSEGKDVPV
jgi:hypothetical protein